MVSQITSNSTVCWTASSGWQKENIKAKSVGPLWCERDVPMIREFPKYKGTKMHKRVSMSWGHDDWIKSLATGVSSNPPLTHLSLDKIAAILQTMFSKAFSWMKINSPGACPGHKQHQCRPTRILNTSRSHCYRVNSLVLRKFEWKIKQLIFKLNLVTDGSGTSCEIALRWISPKLTDYKSTLVQVMAWCF